MSEYYVQTLYAILATAALTLGTRTVVADNFSGTFIDRKPFTCTYCLSFWWAVPVTIFTVDYVDAQTSILTLLAVHICAFWANQKLT